MSTINPSTSASLTQSSSTYLKAEDTQARTTHVDLKTQSNSSSSGIKVNISVEGQKKLAEEGNQLSKTDAKADEKNDNDKTAVKKNNAVSNAEETESKDPIQRLIESIQKRIEEIKEQLTKLEGDDSEAAIEQRKILNEQLVELSNQLLALFEKQARIKNQAALG